MVAVVRLLWIGRAGLTRQAIVTGGVGRGELEDKGLIDLFRSVDDRGPFGRGGQGVRFLEDVGFGGDWPGDLELPVRELNLEPDFGRWFAGFEVVHPGEGATGSDHRVFDGGDVDFVAGDEAGGGLGPLVNAGEFDVGDFPIGGSPGVGALEGHGGGVGDEAEGFDAVAFGSVGLGSEGGADEGGIVIIGDTDREVCGGLGAGSEGLVEDGEVEVLMLGAGGAVLAGGAHGQAPVGWSGRLPR